MMNQKRITENPLAQEFDFRLLLQFAFPTIVMMVFMGLYTIVDTVFVSRFVNTDALSAMNIVCPVINLTVGLGTMLATGGSAIIAREMGEGREIRASQDFTWIICAGVGLGLLISLVGVLFIEPLIRGLGASRRLFPYCREYLMMILFFTPASILQVLFQNFLVTAGRLWNGFIRWCGSSQSFAGLSFYGSLTTGDPGGCTGDRDRVSDTGSGRVLLFRRK